MKVFYSLFLLIASLPTNAQFAIIYDTASPVNVRVEASINSKVIDKLPNGHLIYCMSFDGNWTNVDYKLKNKDGNGYICKDRYKMVDAYSALAVVKETSNNITLQKDSISITIT